MSNIFMSVSLNQLIWVFLLFTETNLILPQQMLTNHLVTVSGSCLFLSAPIISKAV